MQLPFFTFEPVFGKVCQKQELNRWTRRSHTKSIANGIGFVIAVVLAERRPFQFANSVEDVQSDATCVETCSRVQEVSADS
jgi:hypothetical protein